jgi:hypothetical protein
MGGFVAPGRGAVKKMWSQYGELSGSSPRAVESQKRSVVTPRWPGLAYAVGLPSRDAAMPILRLRLTGSEDDVRAVINLLQSLDGIERVEEVADMMDHMDDADSSSAGLSDIRGPDVHDLEVEAPNTATARKVREAVEALAFDLDALVEFEEEDE